MPGVGYKDCKQNDALGRCNCIPIIRAFGLKNLYLRCRIRASCGFKILYAGDTQRSSLTSVIRLCELCPLPHYPASDEIPHEGRHLLR